MTVSRLSIAYWYAICAFSSAVATKPGSIPPLTRLKSNTAGPPAAGVSSCLPAAGGGESEPPEPPTTNNTANPNTTTAPATSSAGSHEFREAVDWRLLISSASVPLVRGPRIHRLPSRGQPHLLARTCWLHADVPRRQAFGLPRPGDMYPAIHSPPRPFLLAL